MIPGTPDRALVVSSVANQVSELIYSETTLEFGREVVLDTGSDTSNMTSIKVAPGGEFAAVTVAQDECSIGEVLFIDIGENFGAILGRVNVGFGPDSGAFSKDGKYFVTADEDDREDHPCKPSTRHGGTISIIDLSAGLGSPTLAQTLPVDHALNSEPEGIAITDDGTAFVTVQETSEVVMFSLNDVPNATSKVISLGDGAGPDAVAISPDGKFAVVGLEEGDGIAVLDTGTGDIVEHYTIRGSGDVPSSYNRDDSDTSKTHEPEGVVVFQQRGGVFVGVVMQESHALAGYAMNSSGALTFDSITQSGVDWSAEASGREKSAIGPEGLTVNPIAGMLIAANEREGSITLFRTEAARAIDCPE